MHIGELIRGFPEPSFPNTSDKDTGQRPLVEILPIRESDKPYQFDFPKLDSNDIQTTVKRTIKDAVLERLFNSQASPSVGLFDGFNENVTPLTGSPSETIPIENPDEESTLSYSYNYSFKESLSLDLHIENNQLSLDLSFSRSLSEELSFSSSNGEIEYSSSRLFEKSLDLSLSVDLGNEGERPSLLSFDFNQSSNRLFTESLTISAPISTEDKQVPTPASSSSTVELVNQQSVSFEKLLISQRERSDTGIAGPATTGNSSNLTLSNAVIQEYLLGLR